MKRIRCRDEDRELQQILAKNPDLLPGDQIAPEDPCRWMLITREMPVPDPSTGNDRWYLDLFLVDHRGIPTFVECKRFGDTRSRREVVAQMLEYVANGHHYWDRAEIRRYAEAEAGVRGLAFEDLVQSLAPEACGSAEDFLEQIETNLREARLRMVFFLEEAPQELKSIVDFLNRQMERSEVLIVEARQYETNGQRIIVPSLFGYTEEARRAKRSASVGSSRERVWNEERFFENAAERLDAAELRALRRLCAFSTQDGFEVRWGRGRITGSFALVAPELGGKPMAYAYSDGYLSFHFIHLQGSETSEWFRDELARRLRDDFGLRVPEEFETKYVWTRADDWCPNVEGITALIAELLEKSRLIGDSERSMVSSR